MMLPAQLAQALNVTLSVTFALFVLLPSFFKEATSALFSDSQTVSSQIAVAAPATAARAALQRLH